MFTSKIYKSKNHHYAVDIKGDKHKATQYAVFRTGCKAYTYRVINGLKLYQVDVIIKDGKVFSEFITEVED